MSLALSLVAGTAEQSGEHTTELPMAAAMFPIIALIVFVALLGLVWTFRGVSNKHR